MSTPQNSLATCPRVRDGDDEIPRQWIAGDLSATEAAEFEIHLRSCTGCQRAVERAAGATAALRSAATAHQHERVSFRRWSLGATVVVVLLVFWLVMRSGSLSP